MIAVRPQTNESISAWHHLDVERFAPFGSLGKKKILTVPWQDLRPQIRLLRGDRQADFYLPVRIIFDYLLVFYFEGTGRWIIGNEKIDVQKRHLLLVPPFTHHGLSMTGNHFFMAVHFDWKPHFPPASRLSKRHPYQVRFPVNVQVPTHQILTAGDPLVMHLHQLLELWQKETDISRVHANSLLLEVLITLLEREEIKKASLIDQHAHTDQRRIEAAIILMQEKLAEELSVEELARTSGLSASHFSHLFHKWTGHTPIEHLTKMRIQKSKELLDNFHLTIKEVANRCGFKAASYYTRIFARSTGLSPSQYREMLLSQRAS